MLAPLKPMGRPPVTTHADVARVALELFERHGFDETTVEMVAAAVGISRSTLFRYYASKNDIVWGEFDLVLAALRRELQASPADEPIFESIRRSVVASNRYPPSELPTLRVRLRLIGTVPALQGHSLLRYEQWRNIIAEFVAERRGDHLTDFLPSMVGQATLGTTMAAFQWWVENSDGDPADIVDDALAHLSGGFPGLDRLAVSPQMR